MKLPVLLCLASTLLTAQAVAPAVEITAEPHHHLTFENKSVRVFYVDIPAHSETLMHWHRRDYVTITLAPAEIVNTVKNKPPVTVPVAEGDTRFASATFAHAVRPLDDRSFRNVTVEILDDANLRNLSSPWDSAKNEDRALETFPGGTRQILFVKDAIRVSEFDLQTGAVFPMQDKRSQLLVAVSELEIRAGATGAAKPAHSGLLKSGDSRWLPANNSATIAPTSGQPAKFVTLEFP